ncbi:DUF6313 family protein [Streptomyces sp. NPDC090088]|uniref:DUF6313 family protein n=1 Tax=Streptomyces sp. NPDC090088 TaxID=3365944 RepID=UPI00381DE969
MTKTTPKTSHRRDACAPAAQANVTGPDAAGVDKRSTQVPVPGYVLTVEQQPSLPPPPRDTLAERIRDSYRGLSGWNRPAYWLVKRGLPGALVFAALYVTCGSVLGWTVSYEILVGITSPAAASHRMLAWVLSLVGWLVTPAVVGGVVGYLVNRQVDQRRQESAEQVTRRMLEEASITAPQQTDGDTP